MEPNWDAIGAVGEIVGAVAVVATLGYLAIQIRSAHRVAADTTRQARAQGVRDMMLTMATNAEARSAWVKAEGGSEVYGELADHFGLTNDEAYLVDYQVMYWVWLHWAQYNSTISESDMVELKGVISGFYSREPMRTYLEKSPNLHTVDPRFLRFVREVIESS